MIRPIKSDKVIYNSLKKNIYKYRYINGFKLVKKFTKLNRYLIILKFKIFCKNGRFYKVKNL
jgi:hypothetical protein